jgi:glycosyltransferase involved in cell wall biosynthesis
VNEPLRRGRITGTDLLPRFAGAVPLDVFGIGTAGLDAALGTGGRIRECGDLPQPRMHAEMARRRVYLHLSRWTSLGLSLIEAMHLGMPVVALAATEAVEAVPPGTGCCSTDPDRLERALRELVAEPELARRHGAAARAHALARYGLDRFLGDWDALLAGVTERRARRVPVASATNGRS